MKCKPLAYQSPEYEAMLDLRYRVLRRPLGLEFDEEQLAQEANDELFGFFDGDTLIGCFILTQEENKDHYRIRQVAVEPEWQGRGIGKAMMLFAELWARQKGAKTLCCHARESVALFYDRLGYDISGDLFYDVRIPHYYMEKTLV